LAGCFVDHRDPELIEHSVGSLVKQRVYGIALGYEDLNDHDILRYDALLGLLRDAPWILRFILRPTNTAAAIGRKFLRVSAVGAFIAWRYLIPRKFQIGWMNPTIKTVRANRSSQRRAVLVVGSIQ